MPLSLLGARTVARSLSEADMPALRRGMKRTVVPMTVRMSVGRTRARARERERERERESSGGRQRP